MKIDILKKIVGVLILSVFFIGCSNSSIDKNERISRFFTMGEAVHSDFAKKHKIKNIPNSRERINIRYTALRMDEVRVILKRPLVVTSWFRSSKLNKAIGGSKTSAHRDGLAVDVLLKKGKAGRREYELVKKKMSSYDQLIYYPKKGHLHVGFRRNKYEERRQNMIGR